MQVVSRGTLGVLPWDWDAGDETVSPEVQLVEAVPLAEAAPLVPVPGEEIDGPVDCEETTELVRLPETGGPFVLLATVVDCEAVPVIPSTALVDWPAVPEGRPVGPPENVEFPVGNAGEADRVPLEGRGATVPDPGVLAMDPGVVEAEVVPDVVRDTSTGLVPVGPTLTTVELGSGKGAELDRIDDGPGDPVPVFGDEVWPPVPPLPVGKRVLEFSCGNGALLVKIAGTLPVPRAPELRGPEDPSPEDGAVGPPVTVWFVRGYGAEELREAAGTVETPVPDPAMDEILVAFGNGNGAELDPVARLVGAVPPPLVREAQALEFVKGKGAEAEEVPGGQVEVPALEDGPAPPLTELESPEGEGRTLVGETSDGADPVPNPELPVGPAVGPPATEELLIGNGGVCIDVRELPGGP